MARERSDSPQYGVAVVKSNSDLSMFGQLRGRRSCHTGFGHLSGWIVPIGALIQDQIVEANTCNRAQVVVDYFSQGSCAPGSADARINPNGTGVEHLCSQCVGDEQGQHICDLNGGERFSGEAGALRCLVEGRGDVAFVSHDTAIRFTDGRSNQPWASNLKSSDFRLLCRPSTSTVLTQPGINQLNSNQLNQPFDDILSARSHLTRTQSQALITDYARCNIARIPDPIVATSLFTSVETRTDSLQLLTQLSEIFLQKNPNSFRLAGVFRNRSNLIFSDRTQSIESLRLESSFEEALGEFLPFLRDNDPIACGAIRLNPSIIIVNLIASVAIYGVVFHAFY